MGRLGACATALALCAGSAAADPPAAYPWTGFYIGAGLGAGTIVQRQEIVDSFGPLFSDTYGATGHFATVTAGYDIPVIQRYVAGLFFDYEHSRMSNDSWSTLLPFDQKHAWSIGGRFGYLATPATLWYGLGGYTRSSFDYLLIGSRNLQGFFAGGGVETQVGGGWSARVEYRFTQYDTETLIDFCGCARLDAETSSHSGRVVLVYRLGNGPVSAP